MCEHVGVVAIYFIAVDLCVYVSQRELERFVSRQPAPLFRDNRSEIDKIIIICESSLTVFFFFLSWRIINNLLLYIVYVYR